MKPPRRRYVGKVLWVTWDDASFAGGQFPLEDIDEGFVCDTYGLCVRQTDKGLTLSMDVPHGMTEYRHSSFMPWGMVRRIQVLGAGELHPRSAAIRSARR